MENPKKTTFQKINIFLEYFWLVLTIACAFLAGYFIYTEGYDEAKWHLIFPLLAAMMYIMRRSLRKKLENSAFANAHGTSAEKKSKKSNNN